MKSKETILAVIALTLLVGFRVVLGVMYRDANSEKLTATQKAALSGPPVELFVRCHTRHSVRDFQAIQNGMTLAQVQRIFGIKVFKQNVAAYLAKSDVLVRFIGPDGSSNEVVLRNGKVIRKHRFNAHMKHESQKRLRNGEPRSAFD